jgi:hypothetical protein
MTDIFNLVRSRTVKLTSTRPGRACRLGLLITAVLVVAIAAHPRNQAPAASAAPLAAEALFEDAVGPEATRLKSAREAAKRGDWELAIHEYSASISDDAPTSHLAIREMVEVFQSTAQACRKDGRQVDESAQINRCYQALQHLKLADADAKSLPELARVTLFREIAHVREVGNSTAKDHIIAADQLRRQAKGKHWWNRDDRNKQAEALDKVNVAWSYYPAFSDEWMVNKMYEVWADMQGELPTWQYNQVMERATLQLGRVVGDR